MDQGPKPTHTYELPKNHRAQLAVFTRNGSEVVIQSIRKDKPEGEGQLLFFDVKSNKLNRKVIKPSECSAEAVFVDGGKKLLTVGWGDDFRLYQGPDWSEVEKFPRLQGDDTVRDLKTDPSGRYLACVHFGFTGPRYWDLTTKKATKFPGRDKKLLESVALSPDAKTLAAAYGAPVIDLIDIATENVKATLEVEQGIYTSVMYTPDGKTLIAGYWRGGNHPEQVQIWDIETKKLRHSCDGASFLVRSLAVTPDSKFCITFTGRERANRCYLSVWSIETGTLVGMFDAGQGSGDRFALSPDGNTVVTIGLNGTVRKWDFAAIRKDFEAKLDKEKAKK